VDSGLSRPKVVARAAVGEDVGDDEGGLLGDHARLACAAVAAPALAARPRIVNGDQRAAARERAVGADLLPQRDLRGAEREREAVEVAVAR
jgi:hypothetical protein